MGILGADGCSHEEIRQPTSVRRATEAHISSQPKQEMYHRYVDLKMPEPMART